MSFTGRVVITGIAGLIGRVVGRFLRKRWVLSGVDLLPNPDVLTLLADITYQEVLIPAFHEAYAVIHLAARDNAQWDEIVHPNILGTKAVFEAAQRAGVRKIVFASSNHVTGLYERDEPYRSIVDGRYEDLNPTRIPRITHTASIRPDGPYGISKALGEAVGRYYSEAFGMEVLCLRIGTVNQQNRPLVARHYATLLTHRDLATLIEACLRLEDVPFDIFYGVSDNTWRFWDIDHPREVLGWIPQDNAEVFRAASA
ncbi:MAG: NAD-dependent epimerase/dehydratase family protein [Thermodesulfobacteriota bacterium]